MTWQITWALILGFALSAVIQAVVRKSTIVRLLGDDRPRTLAVASLLGAASSSCSYAAVALARSLFRKGANFTAAMAFEIASTNLVIELGVILALLMGWQFTAAEFVGGPIMIVVLVDAAGKAVSMVMPGTVTVRLSTNPSPAPGPVAGVKVANVRQVPGVKADKDAVQVPSAAMTG